MIIVSRIMFHSYFIALRKEKWQNSMWKEFQNGLKCYYDEFSGLVFYALTTWEKETATPLNQRGTGPVFCSASILFSYGNKMACYDLRER